MPWLNPKRTAKGILRPRKRRNGMAALSAFRYSHQTRKTRSTAPSTIMAIISGLFQAYVVPPSCTTRRSTVAAGTIVSMPMMSTLLVLPTPQPTTEHASHGAGKHDRPCHGAQGHVDEEAPPPGCAVSQSAADERPEDLPHELHCTEDADHERQTGERDNLIDQTECNETLTLIDSFFFFFIFYFSFLGVKILTHKPSRRHQSSPALISLSR